MSLKTFRSSPASSSMFSCRGPLACFPSSHRGRPNGKVASLGHFSSTQMDLIESLFVSMGVPDPWGSIINPIWAAHLLDLAEAWDHAEESRAVPPQPEEPLENLLVSPPPEEPPENVLVSPQMEALPETVLVASVLRDERFS